MTTTEPAKRIVLHGLNRVRVHKEGLLWELLGAPKPFSSTEWAEVEAEAQRVATRWRRAFAAFSR